MDIPASLTATLADLDVPDTDDCVVLVVVLNQPDPDPIDLPGLNALLPELIGTAEGLGYDLDDGIHLATAIRDVNAELATGPLLTGAQALANQPGGG